MIYTRLKKILFDKFSAYFNFALKLHLFARFSCEGFQARLLFFIRINFSATAFRSLRLHDLVKGISIFKQIQIIRHSCLLQDLLLRKLSILPDFYVETFLF